MYLYMPRGKHGQTPKVVWQSAWPQVQKAVVPDRADTVRVRMDVTSLPILGTGKAILADVFFAYIVRTILPVPFGVKTATAVVL